MSLFLRNGEYFIKNECTNCERHPECTACCKRRNPITGKVKPIKVTPIDVFRMARKLNMTPETFLSKYCDRLRRIEYCLKTEGNDGNCVFLKNGKCKVHGVAALSCKCFPIEITDSGYREIVDPWGNEYNPTLVKVTDYLTKMVGPKFHDEKNANDAFVKLSVMYELLFKNRANDEVLRSLLYVVSSSSERLINHTIATLLNDWMRAG